LGNIRILVVDESRYTRDFVIRNVLQPNDFAALEAANGTTAIRIALHQQVHLILLSSAVATMSTWQVADTLRGRGVEAPIILMTPTFSREVAADMFLHGIHSYILKPFTADELLATLETALASARAYLEQSRLAQDLALVNQRISRLLRTREVLAHIGESATTQMEADEFLNQVLDAALYLTNAEESSIYLNAEDGKNLKRYRHKLRVSNTERQIPRYTEDQLAAAAALNNRVAQAGPMLFAPIRVEDRALGAIGVSNSKSARPFSSEDHYPLKALGGYTALALENNRLLQRVRDVHGQKAQEMRQLFERYISPNIIERIMNHPETMELGGIRQRVSSLFADIRGFSKFSLHTAPEVLVDVLNRHMEVAAEAIMAEHGTLDKFIGDAVMAYFNAPVPQPDHAVRAVRAAWRMCHRIKSLHTSLPGASRLEFGIGISTGEALVGNIGAPQMMNFTIIGDAVNVSRRLQEHAKGGQILVNVQAYEEIRGVVEVRSAGMLEIEGRSQPEPIFEVVRVPV